MSVYPRNLSNFLNCLSEYIKNNVKMNVLGNLDANCHQVIGFTHWHQSIFILSLYYHATM